MLPYNKITPGTYIELNGAPYEVLDSRVFRKQQRKAVNQTKLRNMITGGVTEQTFQQSDKVEEAEIDLQSIIFVYEKRGDYIFHMKGDPSKRFTLSEEIIGKQSIFLVEGMEVTGITYGEEIIGVRLPIKVDIMVSEAPPADKGNTAQGGTKRILLQSGAEIEAPLFIETGDVVRVNTQTSTYDTRVSKRKA